MIYTKEAISKLRIIYGDNVEYIGDGIILCKGRDSEESTFIFEYENEVFAWKNARFESFKLADQNYTLITSDDESMLVKKSDTQAQGRIILRLRGKFKRMYLTYGNLYLVSQYSKDTNRSLIEADRKGPKITFETLRKINCASDVKIKDGDTVEYRLVWYSVREDFEGVVYDTDIKWIGKVVSGLCMAVSIRPIVDGKVAERAVVCSNKLVSYKSVIESNNWLAYKANRELRRDRN